MNPHIQDSISRHQTAYVTGEIGLLDFLKLVGEECFLQGFFEGEEAHREASNRDKSDWVPSDF